MDDQILCFLYLFIVFVVSTIVVMWVFKKIKPQAYDNVQNNELSWLIVIAIIVTIVVIAGEFGQVLFEWCHV
jgi:predicted CDP-diglyceride synthetase/phosphatidate cytidylyltransferase